MTKELSKQIEEIEATANQSSIHDFYHEDCVEELKELARDSLVVIKKLQKN